MLNQIIDVKTGAVCLLSRYKDGKRIDRIYVPHKNRGKGAGSAMLKRVCDQADLENVTLRLIICADSDEPNVGLDNLQLQTWYRKFGFDRDEGALYTYKRLPKCADIANLLLKQNRIAVIGLYAKRARRADLAKILMHSQ